MNIDLSALGPLAGSLARAGLPALGTILGAVLPPPWDLLAGGAFKLISKAMDVDPTAPDAPAQVQAKVDADPAAAQAKLQAIEDDHKDAAEAANRELELRLADVQDARATQVQYAKIGSKLEWASPILAGIIIVGFLSVTLAVIFHAVDTSQTTIYLITVLGGAFLTLVNFYYGSSKGSQDKSDALVSMASAPTVNAAPGSHVSSGVITGGGSGVAGRRR